MANQRNLVKALAQTGKPVILVQNTNDPRLYRICRHYYNIKRSQVKPDKEQNDVPLFSKCPP